MNIFERSRSLGGKVKSFIWQGKFSYMTIVLTAIGVAIGIFLTAQWRTMPSRASDPIISYSSLIQTKEKLITQQNQLKENITDLNKQIDAAQQELKKYTGSKDKVEEIEKDEDDIGLSEMKGNGVVITFDDAKKKETNSESISHAADLRDIVNFLWGQGAEAVSINDERIIFNTSIDCIVNTILINSTKTVPPFKIKAIGDASVLESALNNTNYLSNIHNRVETEGLVFNIEKSDNVIIEPYTGSLNIKYAKIK